MRQFRSRKTTQRVSELVWVCAICYSLCFLSCPKLLTSTASTFDISWLRIRAQNWSSCISNVQCMNTLCSCPTAARIIRQHRLCCSMLYSVFGAVGIVVRLSHTRNQNRVKSKTAQHYCQSRRCRRGRRLRYDGRKRVCTATDFAQETADIQWAFPGWVLRCV